MVEMVKHQLGTKEWLCADLEDRQVFTLEFQDCDGNRIVYQSPAPTPRPTAQPVAAPTDYEFGDRDPCEVIGELECTSDTTHAGDSICSSEETPLCDVYHSNGCDQCQTGTFKLTYDYPCLPCREACNFCDQVLGCNQCYDGY